MANYTIDLTKDFGKIKKELQNRLIDGIKKAMTILLNELIRLTPEDTKDMVSSYSVSSVTLEGDKLIGTISNNQDYAIFVEFGVDGKVYNYHKPKGSKFYSGVGNRTFARAIDNKRQEILNIITKELG